MSAETIQGVKNLLDRRSPELDNLYLSWFGGEPLVTKDIVLDISSYAANLAKAYPGLEYRAGMTQCLLFNTFFIF